MFFSSAFVRCGLLFWENMVIVDRVVFNGKNGKWLCHVCWAHEPNKHQRHSRGLKHTRNFEMCLHYPLKLWSYQLCDYCETESWELSYSTSKQKTKEHHIHFHLAKHQLVFWLLHEQIYQEPTHIWHMKLMREMCCLSIDERNAATWTLFWLLLSTFWSFSSTLVSACCSQAAEGSAMFTRLSCLRLNSEGEIFICWWAVRLNWEQTNCSHKHWLVQR